MKVDTYKSTQARAGYIPTETDVNLIGRPRSGVGSVLDQTKIAQNHIFQIMIGCGTKSPLVNIAPR